MKKVHLKLSVELAGMLILGVSMLAMHNYFAATGVMFAAIFISSTLDRIRNKMEKHVFSRNKSGDFMRLRVKPSNPKTKAQMTSRGAFTQISRQWRTLTPFMREEWNKYSSVNPVSNKFGFQIYLSGFNWYMKVNTPLLYMGLETKISPWNVTKIQYPEFGECKSEFDENTSVLNSFKINYTLGSNSPDIYFEIFMSNKVSSGITSINSVSYRYATKIPTNSGGQLELIDAIAARDQLWMKKDFNYMIYFKIRQVNAVDGTTEAWRYVKHYIHS